MIRRCDPWAQTNPTLRSALWSAVWKRRTSWQPFPFPLVQHQELHGSTDRANRTIEDIVVHQWSRSTPFESSRVVHFQRHFVRTKIVAIMSSEARRCSKCLQEGTLEGLKRCSRCKNTLYCSRACQNTDWSPHKLHCAYTPAHAGSDRSSSEASQPTQEVVGITIACNADRARSHMFTQRAIDPSYPIHTRGVSSNLSAGRMLCVVIVRMTRSPWFLTLGLTIKSQPT
ncbi:hypothetical protein F5I97DRAFT_408697 [Phlebopus sp. FC_14]|nr:hypothetical protein F5I97DRAFT_408697 [Phlebopus sp. FC_14]